MEMEGVEHTLRPSDGEFKLRPWCNHRLYSPVTELEVEVKEHDDEWDGERTVFLLSGQDTDEMFRLDTVFFENWYAYQDLIVVKGEKIDLVQVMSVCPFPCSSSRFGLLTVTNTMLSRRLMPVARISHYPVGYRSVAQ